MTRCEEGPEGLGSPIPAVLCLQPTRLFFGAGDGYSLHLSLTQVSHSNLYLLDVFTEVSFPSQLHVAPSLGLLAKGHIPGMLFASGFPLKSQWKPSRPNFCILHACEISMMWVP